jgi:hypothetical protein
MQKLFTQYKHKTEELTHLAEQLAQREALLMRLRTCLMPAAQLALIGAQIKGDTLILITQSAAWATRLRLEAQTLLKVANDCNLRQYTIQIIPNPISVTKPIKHHIAEKPNEEALTQLKTLTEKLENTDALKSTMLRLLQLVSSPPAA